MEGRCVDPYESTGWFQDLTKFQIHLSYEKAFYVSSLTSFQMISVFAGEATKYPSLSLFTSLTSSFSLSVLFVC